MSVLSYHFPNLSIKKNIISFFLLPLYKFLMSRTGMITNHQFYLMMSCNPLQQSTQVPHISWKPTCGLQKWRQKSTLPEKLRNHIYQNRNKWKRSTNICLFAIFPVLHTKLKEPSFEWTPLHFQCTRASITAFLWGGMFPSQRKGMNGNKRVSLKTHKDFILLTQKLILENTYTESLSGYSYGNREVSCAPAGQMEGWEYRSRE